MDHSVEDEPHIGDEVPTDLLVKTYLKIRDARSALKKRFEDEDAVLAADISNISQVLLDKCKRDGTEGLRTEFGTVSRQVKTRYWSQDWASMYDFMKENDALHLLEKRISQMAMKEFLEENPDKLPPGLSIDSEYHIVIRRSKK